MSANPDEGQKGLAHQGLAHKDAAHKGLAKAQDHQETVVSQDNQVSPDKISPQPITDADKAGHAGGETNRPGFDLGGAKGDQEAGRGLGLGSDARDSGEAQRPPRPIDR